MSLLAITRSESSIVVVGWVATKLVPLVTLTCLAKDLAACDILPKDISETSCLYFQLIIGIDWKDIEVMMEDKNY